MLANYWQESFSVAGLGAFFAWRFLKFRKVKAQLPALLESGALLVDVRSPGEFMGGHHPRSINAPLGELEAKSSSWSKEITIVLCCASGTRSGMAASLLKKNGFKSVVNLGPWTNA